jgi:hypothetical protein
METARKAFMSEKEKTGVDLAMKAMTKGDSEGIFTESYYNTDASDKERKDYDKQAHTLLRQMYSKDKSEGKFENIDFDQYINIVNNAWFDEVALNTNDDDPDFYMKAGDLLMDTYNGDVDQFKLSAKNFTAKNKDKSNIASYAPEKSAY